ncbi:MAG: DUF3160 domain-containing protein [Peptococcaceae bacterium]|nr:DUF3160 domain-containing protein [Peptococcaceae bacterium]
MVLVSGCQAAPEKEIADKVKPSSEVEQPIKERQGPTQPAGDYQYASFSYEEIDVNVTPAVKPYSVAPDLSNITNPEMFQLSDAAKELLVKNGFVVIPNNYREFFELYERNRYQPVPLFITTDSMLHNYHLFFDHLLKAVETEKLIPELQKLTKAMLAESQKQYAGLKGTAWENAAKRNIGFFAVADRLLDPSAAVPPVVKKEVAKELDLIAKHQGITVSPVMKIGAEYDVMENLKEDYSQYIPRGHYDKSEELKAYFKAMMWYGRLTFRLKSEDEVKSAVLMTLALDEGDNLLCWNKIYETTSFFVGKSDDLSYEQFKKLRDEIYGPNAGLEAVVSDQEKWKAFLDAASKLEPPAINSIPIFDETIQPDREKEIKGFRFMGQRFTIDAAVFQRLIYREVKENSRGERRMLPKGLDIPAAMGSKEAYSILKSMGETDYRNYPENMAKMRAYIAGLGKEIWTQNLYWGWMYALLPLTQEKPEGYPSFMRNMAWTRKELNTFLGSWTELKHDTILYAKQVYAEMGGGWEDVDDRGYVEPNPHVYARLAALTKMTREGLQARGFLNSRDQESLARLEQLALALKTISEKELNNTPLTDEEYDLIRSYGGQLEHFWLEALRDEGINHRSALFDRPAALVADVATNSNGWVLEEATGYIYEIYAVVPVDGELRIAVGGVYSYYEFPWPMNDRLTDKKWHKMLDEGHAPPLPEWTKVFMAL